MKDVFKTLRNKTRQDRESTHGAASKSVGGDHGNDKDLLRSATAGHLRWIVAMAYPVIEVPPDASTQLEQLGTKGKFWYRGEDDRQVLFKVGRPGTGENWAEKVCCEIARLLGLPHAEYELATWKAEPGVASPSIVPKEGRLILGNELLAKVYEHEQYDPTAGYRDNQHTLRRVMAVLRNSAVNNPFGWPCPPEVGGAEGVFAGYLLLDALVGNQDRHHENWALIFSHEHGLTLAHTFDHASSLGRNETDAARNERLTTKDAGRSVAHYAARARSALYGTHVSKYPLSTLDAFADARKIALDAGQFWLHRLADIEPNQFKHVLDQIPGDWITGPAINFAYEMLMANRKRLLNLRDTL